MAERPARDQLLDAAERLFGERGLDGVSVAAILKAAGQRNQSALNYYFGDKNGLLAALLRDRFAVIDARRGELLAAFEEEGRGDDPAALLEATVRPLIEDAASREQGPAFAALVAQISAHPRFDAERYFANTGLPGQRRVYERLDALLAGLSPAERRLKTRMVTAIVLQSIAAWTGSPEPRMDVERLAAHLVAAVLSAVGVRPQPAIRAVRARRAARS